MKTESGKATILGRDAHLKVFKETFDTFGVNSPDKHALLLERAPILALVFNDPKDAELTGHLQKMFSQWIPFFNLKAPVNKISEYESMHCAMSLKYLA